MIILKYVNNAKLNVDYVQAKIYVQSAKRATFQMVVIVNLLVLLKNSDKIKNVENVQITVKSAKIKVNVQSVVTLLNYIKIIVSNNVQNKLSILQETIHVLIVCLPVKPVIK